MIQEITIHKISLWDINLIKKTLEEHMQKLVFKYEQNKSPESLKDFSICQEMYFNIEKRLTLKIQTRTKDTLKKNLKLKLKTHEALVLADASYAKRKVDTPYNKARLWYLEENINKATV